MEKSGVLRLEIERAFGLLDSLDLDGRGVNHRYASTRGININEIKI